MPLKTVARGVVALIAASVAVALYGKARWNAGTPQFLYRLDAAQANSGPQFLMPESLRGYLPGQRYFQTALKDRQLIIMAATVQHTGTFNINATAENWKPFTSTQQVITNRPGFAAHIHDAYIAG